MSISNTEYRDTAQKIIDHGVDVEVNDNSPYDVIKSLGDLVVVGKTKTDGNVISTESIRFAIDDVLYAVNPSGFIGRIGNVEDIENAVNSGSKNTVLTPSSLMSKREERDVSMALRKAMREVDIFVASV